MRFDRSLEHAWWMALGLCALGVAACSSSDSAAGAGGSGGAAGGDSGLAGAGGSSGSSGSSGADGGPGGAGGSGGADSGSGGSGGTDSGSGGSGGTDGGSGGGDAAEAGPVTCTELTAGAFKRVSGGDGVTAAFSAAPTPDMGDPGVLDQLSFQVYGSAADPSLNGEATGTFDLAAEANFATCSRCLLLFEDPTSNGSGRVYFQSTGGLNIDAASDQLHGKLDATLTDVTLVEVTIDPNDYTSTPVANGKCVHIVSAHAEFTPPAVPAGWLCDPLTYANSTCDCGCGVIDADCASGAASACQNSACATPVDGSNWTCAGVPADWTCAAGYYGDGQSCDCGCGVVDSDCADAKSTTCQYCDVGSCSPSDCSKIQPDDNSACTP